MLTNLTKLLPVQKFLLNTEARVVVISGDLGSAKTSGGGLFGFASVGKMGIRCNGLYLAQTMTHVRQTLRASFTQVLHDFGIKRNAHYDENKSSGLMEFYNEAKITYGYYMGHGYQRAQSIEYSWILIDEAHLLTKTQYEGFLWRLRHAQPFKIVLFMNPQPSNHWIYKDLILTGKAVHYHARAVDNPYLPPDYIDFQRANMSASTFARMMEGQWILRKGAVFKDSFDPDVHKIQAMPKGVSPVFWYGGLDLGAHTAYVLKCIGSDGKSYAMSALELYRMPINKKAADIINLNETYTSHNSVRIYADHDLDVRDEYRDLGVLTLPATKKDKLVNTAVKEVLLMRNKCFYLPDAEIVADCLANLQYKEEEEIILKKDDHLYDADIYADVGAISCGALHINMDNTRTNLFIPKSGIRRSTLASSYFAELGQ